MDYKYLKIERDNHIATVIFDRSEKLNTLNTGLMSEIITAVRDLTMMNRPAL